MKILFITSSRIGDAVLSTGLLNHIVQTYPDAKITIGCGPLTVSLFEGVPGLERIIPIEKKTWNRHWLAFYKSVSSEKWDMVIDLRDSLVSRVVRAKKRFIFSKHIDRSLHKVEQAAAVMKLSIPPDPHLWFTESQNKAADEYLSGHKKILAVGPTANWPGKTWPATYYIELIKALRNTERGILPDASVAIFAAPGEEEAAYQVFESLPQDKRIDVIAKTDPGTAAAIVSKCDFYAGNDSGLMHCAAATGIPTVGVFGPSYPHLYRPWGQNASFIQTEKNYDELTDFDGYHPATITESLMTSLMPETVIGFCEEFWKKRNTK